MLVRSLRTSLLAVGLGGAAGSPLLAQDTTRVSVGDKDAEGDSSSHSTTAPVTAGGAKALVVFGSQATNFDANDTNGFSDVFLRDLATGTTERIVLDLQGGEPDGDSSSPHVTGDGTFVLFTSDATDLVKGDKNGVHDAFVLERGTGLVERVSLASDDGELNGASFGMGISADGNLVLFGTVDPDVVAADTNGDFDLFLRDRAAGTTTCVSVDLAGVPGDRRSLGGSITPDGSKVVFESDARNLVSNDTNFRTDVFVRDLVAGTTTRVSVNEGGFELDDGATDPTLSPDGRYLAFESSASNLHHDVPSRSSQVYLRDLSTGEIWLASRGVDGLPSNGFHNSPVIGIEADSGEPLIAFWSTSTNLSDDGENDFDVFVSRPRAGVTQCATVDSNGVDPSFLSVVLGRLAFSPEGDALFQTCQIDELVANDGNAALDVFRRGLQWTLLEEFGTGLAGSGGHVPHLGGRSGSCEAGRWSIDVDHGLPNAPGTLWVGFGRTNGVNLFGGKFYVDLAQPFLALPIVLGGPAGVFGAGKLHLDGVNVEDLGEFSLFLQCTFIDARAVRGVSISNALGIAIDA